MLRPTATEVLAVPARTQLRTPLGSDDLNRLVSGKWPDRVRKGADGVKDVATDAVRATGKLLSSVGDIGKELVSKSTSSPEISTVLTGGVSVFAGVKGIKNVLKSLSIMFNQKEKAVSWVLYTLLGVLQLGLSWVAASPFFGTKTPFTQNINGKPVIPMHLVAGGILAPLITSSFINLAEGVSPIGKVPGLGTSLKESAKILSGAVKEVTTYGEHKSGHGAEAGFNPATLAA